MKSVSAWVAAALLAAAAVAAALAPGATAAPALLDYSAVTMWDATPVVSDPARFAEVKGTKCGKGVCAFENAVCCKNSGTCCEWGACVENAAGVTQCQASKEQNALLLAKAFAKDEARKEVMHEQNRKAKSEAGQKLAAEAATKHTQEAAEKKQATAEEAAAKNLATKKHQEKLDRQEANEEKSKVKEARAKKRAQRAMVNRFKKQKVTTFNAGRPFNSRTNRCFAYRPAGGKHFTVSFWAYNREDAKFSGSRHILSAGPVVLYTRFRGNHMRLAAQLRHTDRKKWQHVEARHSLPMHRWSHLSVVVEKHQVTVYLNRRVVIRRKTHAGFRVTGGTGSRVCAALGKNVLNTRVADLQAVSSVLSTAQVAALVKARRHDKVKAASSVTTLIDGPFSPVSGKALGTNNMLHSGAYSMGLWLRATGLADTVTNIVHKGDSNGGESVWLNVLPKGAYGTLQVRSGRGGKPAEFEVPNDKWFHFAWSHGGGRLRLFVNGKRVSDAAYRNPRSIASQPLYASNPWGRQTPASPIIAANLVFASRRLTAADLRAVVSKIYDHGFQPKGVQLVKHANVATAKLTVPDAKIPDSTCRTWAFWIKPTGKQAGWRSIFHKGKATSQRAPAVWFHPNTNKLHIRSGTRENANYGVDYNEDLPQNVWSHVAFIHCRSKMQVFVNAQKKGEDLKALAPNTNDGDLYVPKTHYGGAKAEIADLRYWTLALNQKMIHKLTEVADHP